MVSLSACKVEKNYSFIKAPSFLDVAPPGGADDELFLTHLDIKMKELKNFSPDFIFYQMGVDPIKEDKLGKTSLSFQGLMSRDECILGYAHENKIPIFLALGDGYALLIELRVGAYTNTYRLAKKSMSKRAIIIGSGVAGLACALTLKKGGFKPFILESESRVGGRIKTESSEGFLFDRGFQVLLNSYPELPNFISFKKLKLQNFNSGALIYGEDYNRLLANPLRHPKFLMTSLFSDIATLGDKMRVGALLVKVMSSTELQYLKGQTTLEFLKEFGFSERFISHFWQPFFTGVYLDKTLSLDAHYFLFLLRAFSIGSVSLPANGMEEIPKQMASTLDPESILTSARVSEIKKDHVKLENGETLQADFVIKAFNSVSSNATSNSILKFRSVTTYYFCSSEKPDWGKWLLLVPPGAGYQINSVSLLSEVSSGYAPPGQVLFSASVVGGSDQASPDLIRDELIHFSRKKLNLRHISTVTVKHALPIMAEKLSSEFSLDQEVYECGDHLSAPSLNGALRSGRLCAMAIIKKNEN